VPGDLKISPRILHSRLFLLLNFIFEFFSSLNDRLQQVHDQLCSSRTPAGLAHEASNSWSQQVQASPTLTLVHCHEEVKVHHEGNWNKFDFTEAEIMVPSQTNTRSSSARLPCAGMFVQPSKIAARPSTSLVR
jgi:hypothetical protein